MSENSVILLYVSLIIAGRLLSVGVRKTVVTREIAGDYTAMAVLIVPIISVVVPIAEYLCFSYKMVVLMLITGMIIIIAGFAVAYSANGEIGENWSAAIDKGENQKLVTSGIYGHIRHPLYLSGMLLMTGTAVYFQSRFGGILILPCFLIINWRIGLEESKLISRFENDYREYMKKTWKILPYLH